jgi:hypothetical protein
VEEPEEESGRKIVFPLPSCGKSRLRAGGGLAATAAWGLPPAWDRTRSDSARFRDR